MKLQVLEHWKFSLDRHTDPWNPGYDDSGWQDVVIPHDWGITRPFSREWSSGTGYLPGGTGWYRTVFSFPLDGAQDAQKVFINFDGVYKNSQVWCNGYYLGKRPSGYSAFEYDISHCVRRDGNVIAVKVSHEDISDSRWYTGSGIYRKAYLRSHGPLYIRQDSIVTRTDVRDGTGFVSVSGEAIGEIPLEQIRVRALLSGGGDPFVREIVFNKLDGPQPFTLDFEIPSPALWSPETPNLYRLTLEAGEVSGTRKYTSPPLGIGIRTIKFNADTGFFINGVNTKIKGVCLHHDAGCLGAAVRPEVWRRRLEKLKDAGCNAIRMSHNPHMEELYDLCDEMGFYVMDEAFDEWEGCKNKWALGHNVYPPRHQGYAEDFPEWHERDIAGMVIRHRNHPCIIIWSIGNEIDYPNDPYAHPLFAEMTGNNDADKPKDEMRYSADKPNMERLASIAAKLAAIVKKHDPSRPVLAASAFPELSSQLGFFDALDIAGYNYKEQLYEADHRRFPSLPIIGSENTHSAAAWKAVQDKPYIGGQFLWTGADFLGEARGWPVRASGSGLLDLAGFEKAAFFRRKSMWTDKALVYLASCLYGPENEVWELSRKWNYPAGSETRVICYTNLEKAELFLNSKSLGTGKKTEDCLSWRVPFEKGTLEVSGTGCSDKLESVLPPVKTRLSLWKPSVSPVQSGAYILHQVELELLDEQERLCTAWPLLITAAVRGKGALAGMENGDITDCTEYSAPYRRTFGGRLILYVLAGQTAVLTVRAEGCPPAEISLPVRCAQGAHKLEHNTPTLLTG